MVAWGNHQRPGVDYGVSFSPVIRLESLRPLAAIRNLDVILFDIPSAYLHGALRRSSAWSSRRGIQYPGRDFGSGDSKRVSMDE